MSSFSLNTTLPLADALRLAAQEQIMRAQQQLRERPAGRSVAIHEARKALKRVRALLALHRRVMPKQAMRHNKSLFRDAARLLGPARDAVVRLNTLDAMRAHYADVFQHGVWQPARAALLRDAEDTLLGAVQAGTLEAAAAMLDDGLVLAAAWPDATEDMLRRSLADAYRQATKGLAAARAARSPEPLHEWRKHVKALWYASDFLAPLLPPPVPVKALDELGEQLGLTHDLDVLALAIAASSATPDHALARRAVRATLHAHERSQAKHALHTGARLFTQRWRDVRHALLAPAPAALSPHSEPA